MNEQPWFRKITIFFVDLIPNNNEFFNNIYPPISKLYGYFLFRLNDCIDPECNKKGMMMIVSPEFNPTIINLCNKYLKHEIEITDLYPYYTPPL
jgi:hypothetical protein